MVKRNFRPNRRMFKGNFHTHTTSSDGACSPGEAAIRYHEHGYDFLALTDHWRAVDSEPEAGILIVPGVEFDGQDPELGLYHLVGLNIRSTLDRGSFSSLAETSAYIAEKGGVAILCHPYWCGMPGSSVTASEGVAALEVYNSTCEVHIAKGLSAVHWDEALTSGKRLWGLAVDDTHWHNPDFGGGWIMMEADELTVDSLMKSLVQGRFYATTGPDIIDFFVDGYKAQARTSPAKRIAFVCDGPRGKCVYSQDGGSVVGAEMELPKEATYVRLEVDDDCGKRAWSNPIYLD